MGHSIIRSLLAEILGAFKSATQCASEWAEAWHIWALFNTAVSSHYTSRGYLDVAVQYVVAAITGYFHTIACAANAKGDNCLQVNNFFFLFQIFSVAVLNRNLYPYMI